MRSVGRDALFSLVALLLSVIVVQSIWATIIRPRAAGMMRKRMSTDPPRSHETHRFEIESEASVRADVRLARSFAISAGRTSSTEIAPS